MKIKVSVDKEKVKSMLKLIENRENLNNKSFYNFPANHPKNPCINN